MAPFDSTVRKLPEPAAPQYRNAPQNIEAEQALLGAILVNNEAFYRVSDFLEPQHFFEPIHQQLYELAANLIRAGKIATPVTLKTFLPSDMDIGGLNASQYLARLAAEATTVINAADYGRTISDLAVRRNLIRIGEDMVNVGVRRAGRFRAARADRGRRAQALRDRRDEPLRLGLPALRPGAHHRGRHGRARLPARRQAVRPRHRPERPRRQDGRPAVVRPDHRRRPPRHGQDRARHQHRLQHRQGPSRRDARRRPYRHRRRRHRRLLLARNVGRAARHPHHRRAHRHSVEPHPARRHHRGRFRDHQGRLDRAADACRSMSTRPAACRSRSLPPARGGSSASAASTCW